MARQGFGHVKEDGFLGFKTDLEKGEWEKLKPPPPTDPATPPKGSLQMPVMFRWRLRLTRSLFTLGEARKRPEKLTAHQIDKQRWEPAQNKLDNESKVFLTRDDPAQKAATLLVREEMLIGGGRGQNRLTLHQEVIHGRMQVRKAREELADEIALLGFEDIIDEIELTTEELAEALGDASTPHLSPSDLLELKVRQAMSGCVRAFNAVLDDIDWQMAQNDTSSQEKTRLEKLRAPILTLLATYKPQKPGSASGA